MSRTQPYTTATQSSPPSGPKKDWSAAQYLKFAEQRTRPARDLLAHVPLDSVRRVLDIGCGPGNSTEVLAARYPGAQVTGIDSSPDMIATARKAFPGVQFTVADLTAYTPEQPADLLFANAVLQWVDYDERIPTMKRLLRSLQPNGIFAMQVPDNYTENSHAAMRTVAETGPWAELLGRARPSFGPFQTPQLLYDQLIPMCSSIDIWHTIYHHPLDSHEGIVEWVKGTGLRPFIDPLSPDEREAFLSRYLEQLKKLYPSSADGKVLLRYPRLFMVAVRG